MKKNILFITANTHVPWGGSEELWSKTAKFLAEEGQYNIYVLAENWQPMPAHIKAIVEAGGYFESFPEEKSTIVKRVIKSIKTRIFNIHEVQRKESKLLEQMQPDFVILSLGSQLQGATWMNLMIENNIPYTNIIQLASELQWAEEKKMLQLATGYQNAQHNFFVAQKNLDFTARQMAIPLKNASVVRNPYKVKGKKIPYPSTENGFHLACPASYVIVHKGQDILLALFAQKKWRNRSIYLHLYGKGPSGDYFRRYIKYKKLNKVIVEGFATDIDTIWEKNHAIILASRMEGLPLALVEASLCGRTAIAPDIAGITECVIDNNTGFVAKAPTIDLLDEALERAWEKRNEWESFGNKAAENVNRIIPNDPIKFFANNLKKIIGS